MKNFLLILLCFLSQAIVAQNNDIKTLKANGFQQRQDIDKLNKQVRNQQFVLNQLRNSVSNLSTDSEIQRKQIDSLLQVVQSTNLALSDNVKALEAQSEASQTQFSEFNNSLSKNQLFWIIGSLVLLFLGFLIYYLLGKKINSNQNSTEAKISATRQSLEEESIKLDSKLVELLETQLKLKQEELKAASAQSSSDVDHSLALKVADEIIRIQKNLSRMDAKTKGLKQLRASVKRIQSNFMAKGYEIVEMLGQEYKEGMKVSVNFIQDDDAEEGKKIITRIIKPQVNYNGTMIQPAQIEVTEN